MKVLIIGGNSLIGNSLYLSLKQLGIETDRTYLSHPIADGCLVNIRDPKSVNETIEKLRPDVIVLSVMERGGADFCEKFPEQAYLFHREGARHVSLSAAKNNAKLVFYSSDYIFDGKNGPYTEDDSANPISVYGKAKWEAEEIIRALVPNHLIIRTTAVFGWDRKSINLAMQLWNALESKQTIKIPSDQWCTPTLAADLAKISARLIQENQNGTINVVGQDRMSRYELATALAQSMHLDSKHIVPSLTKETQQTAPRPMQGGLQTKKLQQVLKMVPPSLQESLRTFSDQYQSYMQSIELSCVIPAFNEEASIGKVLEGLAKKFQEKSISYEIIVVDNGSTDKTNARVQEFQKNNPLVKLIYFEKNQGYGGGLTAGLQSARGRILSFLGADGEATAENLMQVYDVLLQQQASICKANRLQRQDGSKRKLFSHLYRIFIKYLFHLDLLDINGYPLLITRSSFEKMNLTKKNWMFNLQLLDQGLRTGATIQEVPIQHQKRIGGKSKVSWWTAVSMLAGVLRYYYENKAFPKNKI